MWLFGVLELRRVSRAERDMPLAARGDAEHFIFNGKSLWLFATDSFTLIVNCGCGLAVACDTL